MINSGQKKNKIDVPIEGSSIVSTVWGGGKKTPPTRGWTMHVHMYIYTHSHSVARFGSFEEKKKFGHLFNWLASKFARIYQVVGLF